MYMYIQYSKFKKKKIQLMSKRSKREENGMYILLWVRIWAEFDLNLNLSWIDTPMKLIVNRIRMRLRVNTSKLVKTSLKSGSYLSWIIIICISWTIGSNYDLIIWREMSEKIEWVNVISLYLEETTSIKEHVNWLKTTNL